MYVKAFRQRASFIALNLTAGAKRGWVNLKLHTWQVSWRLLWVHCHQTKQWGELRTSKEMCVSGQIFRHKDIKDFLSTYQSRVGRVPVLTGPEWVKRCVTVDLTQADTLHDEPVIAHDLAGALSVLSQTSIRDMTSQHNKPPDVCVYGRVAEDFCSQRYMLRKYKQLDIRMITASVWKVNTLCKNLSCSCLDIYFYITNAYPVLVIAALGRLALSSSYTVSVCVREANVQTSYYRGGRMKGAGEIGKKETKWKRKTWWLKKCIRKETGVDLCDIDFSLLVIYQLKKSR